MHPRFAPKKTTLSTTVNSRVARASLPKLGACTNVCFQWMFLDFAQPRNIVRKNGRASMFHLFTVTLEGPHTQCYTEISFLQLVSSLRVRLDTHPQVCLSQSTFPNLRWLGPPVWTALDILWRSHRRSHHDCSRTLVIEQSMVLFMPCSFPKSPIPTFIQNCGNVRRTMIRKLAAL